MNVDELKCGLEVFMVHDDYVVFIYAPIGTPQPALDVVLVLVYLEVFVLLLVFELDQYALSGL